MLNFQNQNFENFENPVRARKVFFSNTEHFFCFTNWTILSQKKICVKKKLVQKFQRYHGKKVKILKIAQNMIFLRIEQFWVKKKILWKKKFGQKISKSGRLLRAKSQNFKNRSKHDFFVNWTILSQKKLWKKKFLIPNF